MATMGGGVPMAVTQSLLEAFVEAFNKHDADAVMSFFADDCVFETPRGDQPWGTRLVGKDAVRTGVEGRFRGIPDVHYGDDEHWIAGSHATSKWLLTGTSTDGERIEVHGCDLLDFDGDGKISR